MFLFFTFDVNLHFMPGGKSICLMVAKLFLFWISIKNINSWIWHTQRQRWYCYRWLRLLKFEKIRQYLVFQSEASCCTLGGGYLSKWSWLAGGTQNFSKPSHSKLLLYLSKCPWLGGATNTFVKPSHLNIFRILIAFYKSVEGGCWLIESWVLSVPVYVTEYYPVTNTNTNTELILTLVYLSM